MGRFTKRVGIALLGLTGFLGLGSGLQAQWYGPPRVWQSPYQYERTDARRDYWRARERERERERERWRHEREREWRRNDYRHDNGYRQYNPYWRR